MFTIDQTSKTPINKQIYDNIKRLILIGAIKEGEQLPSVRSLAQTLLINPNTVHKAYQELESNGIVYSIPQKGLYANKISDDTKLIYQKELEEKFVSTYNELAHLGLEKQYLIDLLK